MLERNNSCGNKSSIRLANSGEVKTSSLLRLAKQLRMSGLYVFFIAVKLCVMQRGIGAHGFIETLRLALLVEKAVLVALRDKEVKLEVAPRDLHTARYGCPFAEDDGLVLGSAIGQCIAADDILLQHVSQAFFIAIRTVFFAHLIYHLGKKSFTASLDVVGQDVNTIAGAHGDQALELPFDWCFIVFQKGKFTAQNLDKEIAVAAGRLKKAAVEPKRLVAHQVEHGVHLARIGEHLAMVSHPLAAFDLFCVFVAGHKKSWNFAYAL